MTWEATGEFSAETNVLMGSLWLLCWEENIEASAEARSPSWDATPRTWVRENSG